MRCELRTKATTAGAATADMVVALNAYASPRMLTMHGLHLLLPPAFNPTHLHQPQGHPHLDKCISRSGRLLLYLAP